MSDRRKAERRKPGRPRTEEARSSVSSWIPATTHDQLIAVANQREQSVSSLVRQFLTTQLRRGN